MNKLELSNLDKFFDYLIIENENFKIGFSTAENKKNFNRHTVDGVNTLNNLKDEFNVKEVVYLRQVHSDKVLEYKDNSELFIENEGDSIITKVNNVVLGVFTADCVPVLIIDNVKKVGAAIHSGWKGTFNSITKKTVIKLKETYNCKSEDITVYIGPHIRQCCYEVSEELKEKFIKKTNIDENILFNNRNLSLEECILKDLKEEGIKEENINSINLCTYCSEKINLHSYRKSNGNYGRLFSFIILK